MWPMGNSATIAKAGSGGMPLELSAGNLSQYFFKIDFVKKAGVSSPSRRTQVCQLARDIVPHTLYVCMW